MSDFIREVDEEYRRDRAMQFLSRYQVVIAIFVVAVIAGAGGWRYWQDSRQAASAKLFDRYTAANQLARDGKTAEAEAAFSAIAKDGAAGYAILSRMRAAEFLAARDPEAAAKQFDEIANDTTASVSMRDTARFRGALLRIGLDDPKAFEQRYGRFGTEDFTYRNSMRELLALTAFKRRDFAAAGRYLDQIIVDGGAPPALRGRAQALRQLVASGPADDSTKPPRPADIKPLGAPAQPNAPAPASATPTPPAPTPATPPAATAQPTPAPAPAPAAPKAPEAPKAPDAAPPH